MRVYAGLSFTVLLLACLLGFTARPVQADTQPLKQVVLFGDSLAHEAGIAGGVNFLPQDRFVLTNRTISGTSPCDWTKKLDTQPLGFTPDIVLIETAGNNRSSCQRINGEFLVKNSPAYFKMYKEHLQGLIDKFPKTTKIYLELAPATKGDVYGTNKKSMLTTMVTLSKRKANSNVSVYNAGRKLEKPAGKFSLSLKCLKDFPCTNQPKSGYFIARAPDGVHFCPDLPPLDDSDNPRNGGNGSSLDNCKVVSVGAMIFASELAAPVLRDYPAPVS